MDRIIKKKKWTPKRVIMISFIVLFFGFVGYHLAFMDYSSSLRIEEEKITISQVKQGVFQEYIPVIGTILPAKIVFLDAIEGGIVEELFVEEGEFLKKGDKILKLANTNLLLDIMYREAQFFEQINNLRNTRLDMERNRLNLVSQILEINNNLSKQEKLYTRYKFLFENELISKEEYENIKREYEYLREKKEIVIETHEKDSLFRENQIIQLESSVSYMEKNLNLAKKKLENLELKSPIDGQLTSLNAEIGESKSGGEKIGQVDVLDQFKVQVSIDEHYISRIFTGLEGEFDFANENFRIKVKKIYPEVIDGKFLVDMVFSQGIPQNIRRGQTLHIRLELGDLSEATLLARGGFYNHTGGQWVFVLDESGKTATKKSIKLGRQNPEFYEVLEGLETGEKVITSSYDLFGNAEKLVLQ